MGVFGMLKNYAIGFLTLIAGFFFVRSKYQAGKIEDLEEDNAHHEKLEQINEDVEKAGRESEAREAEALKNHDESNWRNEI